MSRLQPLWVTVFFVFALSSALGQLGSKPMVALRAWNDRSPLGLGNAGGGTQCPSGPLLRTGILFGADGNAQRAFGHVGSTPRSNRNATATF